MSLQIRRGTSAELANITPVVGELIYTTDTQLVYVGDGSTAGGIAIAVGGSGNVSGTNLLTTGIASATGNVYGNNIFATGFVSAGGNVTGNYILGNGALLTGVVTSATAITNGNSTVEIGASNGNANISINGTSNVVVISNTQVLVTGAVSASGNITGSYFFGNGSQLTGVVATSVGTLPSLSVTGNIVTGNLNSLGAQTTIGNVVAGNLITAGSITATGNVTGGLFIGNGSQLTGMYSNTSVASYLPTYTGNIGAGNVLSTGLISAGGNISATGNISGNYILGNGSQLTGLPASYSNANVATFLASFGSNTVSTTGNVTAGYFTGNGSQLNSIAGANVSGTVANATYATSAGTATSATTAGTVTTAAQGNITSVGTLTSLNSSGNVTGANLLTGGIISATGNVFGGNALFSGNLTVNGNVTYINSNVVTINDIAINLANNAANVSQTNNGGLELGPQGSPYVTFLYNSSANTWVSSAGLSATANVVGGNVTTGGQVSATGNVTAGNVLTAGIISSTGNATAGNLSVSTGTVTAGNIVNANGNAVGNIGSSSNYFNTVFATATTALYADLAECYAADKNYEPGTVVKFGGSAEVTACDQDSCPEVAGVISTNPAYKMNSGLASDHVAVVALVGRVPVKVQGPVKAGAMMVSAGNGRARAEINPAMGTVIGKAVQSFDGDSGTIEIVVGRL